MEKNTVRFLPADEKVDAVQGDILLDIAMDAGVSTIPGNMGLIEDADEAVAAIVDLINNNFESP